jgi:hypothetical protein
MATQFISISINTYNTVINSAREIIAVLITIAAGTCVLNSSQGFKKLTIAPLYFERSSMSIIRPC